MTSEKAEDFGKIATEAEEPADEVSRTKPSVQSFDTPLSRALEVPLGTPVPSVTETPRRVPFLPGEPLVASSKNDTLLSAPPPAERLELIMEDRLSEFQQRIAELDARVEALEKRPAPPPTPLERPWWVWIAFLLMLAIGWQLLSLLR